MPVFEPINFPELRAPTAVNPLAESIGQGLQTFQEANKSYFAPQISQQDLKAKILENMIKKPQAEMAPQITSADLASKLASTDYTKAQTGAIPFENQLKQAQTTEQQIKNKYLDALQKVGIDKETAEAHYYNMGGGRGSTGTRDELAFQNSVATDNPSIVDPIKLREAYDAVANGETTLSDGTPLKISGVTRRYYDRAFRSTTTAPLITAGSRANQAQAEMPIFDRYITAGRSPYGTTIFGKSPQQIKDSLDVNNPEAQMRLGKYIASDVLAFDKAALQTRIAGTESGVTIIDEMMRKAKQTIDAKYPMLSDTARQIALDQYGKALTEGLAARNKYGVGASGAAGRPSKSYSQSDLEHTAKKYNMTVEQVKQKLGVP